MAEPYYRDEFVTLYHGDCRELTAWLAADVLVTDPPYGMGFRSGMGGKMGDLRVAGDADTATRDQALALWTGPALVFGRWNVSVPDGARMRLTWDKGNHVGMGDLAIPWKPNTEDIFVIGTGFTGHRGSSVLRHLAIAGCVGRENTGQRYHPVEKPVPLLADLLAKCPPGTIADPFAGGGSTLVTAKRLGRRAIGVEIEERYCEVIAKRLSQDVLDFGEAAV
jgi:DNA modification methylase